MIDEPTILTREDIDKAWKMPPVIRQKFNPAMLMPRYEIYHLSHLKVIEKCLKKISNHGPRKKQQFDVLISKYMEKYEQAKIKEESKKKDKKTK